MQAEFEVVKQARSWFAKQNQERTDEQTRPPSDKTVELYRREMTRLLAHGDPWTAAADTTKKSTFFVRRAAILHFCREVVGSGLKAQDQLQRGGFADPAQKEAWLTQIKSLKNAPILAEKVPDKPPMHLVAKRQTKRKGLFTLPPDWRQTLISRMPNYEQAATISALCGCRPAELVKGVEVFVQAGQLVVRIHGSKVGPASGQEWREMHWNLPSSNPLAIAAGRFALKNGGHVIVKTPDAKAFSGAMREAGKRAFPGFNRTITPYSMRHQVASDLKAAELPGEQISQALGHSASDTKGSYGEWGAGNGAMAPSSVAAARAVKVKPATKPTAGPVLRL